MMLSRRRAAVPQVFDEFFARAGARFAPQANEETPTSLSTFKKEMANAKDAAAIAARMRPSTVALLFERALLAEMEGRLEDAAGDLALVLESYPGFVAAALMAGRLALARGEAVRAVEVLAYVECEIAGTREGAGLLADALRAIGMADKASRYDVAALTSPGYVDSRGNDCAPVDTSGNFVTHRHMLPAFCVEPLPGGQSLYNDRGVYYFARFTIIDLLLSLFRRRSSVGVRTQSQSLNSTNFRSRSVRYLRVRLKPFVHNMRLHAKALNLQQFVPTEFWRQLSWIRLTVAGSFRSFFPQLAACGFLVVLDGNRRSPVAQARLQSGIIAIFGSLGLVSRIPPGGLPSCLALGDRPYVDRAEVLPPMAAQALGQLVAQLNGEGNGALHL
jgi:hypothetical protein